MTTARNDTLPATAPAASAPDRLDHKGAEPMPPEAMLDSAALLQGSRAVTIRHNGEIYRLQATRQGKLILTK